MKMFKKSAIRKSETAGCHQFCSFVLRSYDLAYQESDHPSVKENRSVERKYLDDLPWHPFVAGLLGTFVDERNLYQLMELGQLGSLSSLLKKRGPLPSQDARFYFANLVLAVEFIHSQGVIHRDLKPENILVGADGYLMLGDFGCAAHHTFKGNWMNVGTTLYMPPENVFEKDEPDPELRGSMDWYASGVVLYEMAAGILVSCGELPRTPTLKSYHPCFPSSLGIRQAEDPRHQNP